MESCVQFWVPPFQADIGAGSEEDYQGGGKPGNQALWEIVKGSDLAHGTELEGRYDSSVIYYLLLLCERLSENCAAGVQVESEMLTQICSFI